MAEQFKRAVAYKIQIGDLSKGKQVIDNDRFKLLELGDRKIIRVNIIANIVEKYEQEGEKKFISFTIDDGSGQIKLRNFGEEVEKFRSLELGESVVIIGVLRSYNNELYILPEIIKKVDPRYLLVRKLELQKGNKVEKVEGKTSVLKDQIIEMMKKEEENGGIDVDKIIMSSQAAPELINQEIQKLLEDGLAYEPRPGRIRFLG